MSGSQVLDAVVFQKLSWDTEFFGISCAKAILYQPLSGEQWSGLSAQFGEYQFVTIENRNSDPVNAQHIGKETAAFLADVNIQFTKKPVKTSDCNCHVEICQSMEKNDKILEQSEFIFSRFTEDPDLVQRGGAEIYKKWLENSFDKENKYFAVAKEDEMLLGYLLYSYFEDTCTVELISVAGQSRKSGIGTKLFQAVEREAYEHGCTRICVGTQLRNTDAINFYHKCGCKQVGCHQVYHLWNLKTTTAGYSIRGTK